MNFIKIAFITLFVLVTALTIGIKPSLHQPVFIEDSNFKLVRISDNITPQNIPTVSVQTTETPVQTTTVTTPQTTVEVYQQPDTTKTKVVNVSVPEQTKTTTKYVQETPTKTKEVVVKTNTNPTDKSQLELLERIMKNSENQQVVEKPVETKPQSKTESKTVQTPKPVTQPTTTTQTKPVTTTTNKTNKNPYMTEQEEIIAWNIWRSNIQNQIMRDSDIGFAPQGTIFTFSFVVDKFGNISNIKVSCSNPYFMDTARQGVKPAISGMQGKPILNFPKGTQRTVTTVNGNFVISSQNIFSTPNDFSDYERVKH